MGGGIAATAVEEVPAVPARRGFDFLPLFVCVTRRNPRPLCYFAFSSTNTGRSRRGESTIWNEFLFHPIGGHVPRPHPGLFLSLLHQFFPFQTGRSNPVVRYTSSGREPVRDGRLMLRLRLL